MIHPAIDFYDTICDWWDDKSFPILPISFLNRGYVSTINDKPIFAGFLLKDESMPVGFFTFFASNPEAVETEKSDSFKELSFHVEKLSKDLGITILVTPTNNQSLSNRLLKEGFKIGDQNITHFFKEI